MKTLVLSIALLASSTAAHAIACGPYSIYSIQSQTDRVLVGLYTRAYVAPNSGPIPIWKSLGSWSSPNTKRFLETMEFGLRSGFGTIWLLYDDPYVCNSDEYATQPVAVRLSLTPGIPP
ncbi:hypothetical protein [Piscinibacter koreensis]|uniref:Uncharacterized protein n=1 Tax=Piscinibacter koreensis TaxID=2742824 RepID=A0A7Y6NMS6_9BURK|nr:hypothetical protein [Schlegelella koreensis]NUZ06027.1 hypothetical protein [Schlegelella koreensis]